MSTLNYLASFHAVSSTLNISRAAKELGLTQPSLSRQLKLLEEELGFALFVRKQHGISLTDAGKKLQEALVPVFTSLNERLELLRSHSGVTKGHLRIASLTELGKSFVLPRLIAFARNFPDVSIDLQLLKGEEILKSLQDQKSDLGFVAILPQTGQLKATRLFDERSFVVTRSSHVRDITSMGDMLSSLFVAYRSDDPLLASFITTYFPSMQRRRLLPHICVNDHKSMVDLLLQFDYYAVMPIHSVKVHLDSGSLRIACKQQLTSKVWLLSPSKGLSAQAKAFSKYLEISAHEVSEV